MGVWSNYSSILCFVSSHEEQHVPLTTSHNSQCKLSWESHLHTSTYMCLLRPCATDANYRTKTLPWNKTWPCAADANSTMTYMKEKTKKKLGILQKQMESLWDERASSFSRLFIMEHSQRDQNLVSSSHTHCWLYALMRSVQDTTVYDQSYT